MNINAVFKKISTIKEIFRSGMGIMIQKKMNQNKTKGITFLDRISNSIDLIHKHHPTNLQDQLFFKVNYFLICFSTPQSLT